MMKWVIYILLVFMTIPLYGQIDTCFTKDEIISMAKEKKALIDKTNTQDEIIVNLKTQTEKLEFVNTKQNSMLEIQNKEIAIYHELAEKVYLPSISKTPWYKNQTLMFAGGVVIGGTIVYLGAVIVSMIRVGG